MSAGGSLVFGTGAGAERMRITSAGSVGVATNSPSYPVHLVSTNYLASAPTVTYHSAGGAFSLDITGNAELAFGWTNASPWPVWIQARGASSTAQPLCLQPAGGNIGIGLTAPAHQLHLSTDDAAKLTTSTWTIASDARLKRNVRPLAGGLDVIRALEVVEAEYNGEDGTPNGMPVVSLLADKVAGVLPRCVTRHRGKIKGAPTDVLDLNVHEILMHAILAIQQLAERTA